MIEVDRIHKRFGAKMALEDLSFRVAPGEIVGLVGKNGAGKSTTLRILSCQAAPNEGDVRIDGASVTHAPGEVRRHIGYLPEVPPLYPEMRVRDFLAFSGGLRGLRGAELKRRCEAVLREANLKDVPDERLGNLSRGFRQRVGIAQAIVHDPKVVLLDEPMAGLDPLQISQFRGLIRSLRERHTVLFSSHILSEIATVCDRVVLIDKGRVLAEGTEEEMWRNFQRRMRVVVRLRGEQDAARQAVTGLPGVSLDEMETEPGGRVVLHLHTEEDARENLARALVNAGLGLIELRTERHGLEEVFVRLVGGKEGP